MNDESFLNLDQLSEFLNPSSTSLPSNATEEKKNEVASAKKQENQDDEIIELDLTKLKQEQPTTMTSLPFAHCIQLPGFSSLPALSSVPTLGGGLSELVMDLFGLPGLVSRPAGVICSIEINKNHNTQTQIQDYFAQMQQPQPQQQQQAERYYEYDNPYALDVSDSDYNEQPDDWSRSEPEDYYRSMPDEQYYRTPQVQFIHRYHNL